MKNELFTIGSLTVYGYGFMIATGVLAAWIVTEYRAKKQNLDSEHVFSLVLWCLMGGLFFAKLLFWITEWKSIAEDPGFFFDTLADGFVVYGGIIGGILAGWMYCRIKKAYFWKYFDLVMPSVALAQGFGRIGCFLAGCCYGRETDSIISVTFQNSDFASILDFLHFGILLYIARRKKADGQVAAFYLIFYSIGRFVLEFFRGDLIRGSVGSLSTSQFISLFILAAGIAILITRTKKKNA